MLIFFKLRVIHGNKCWVNSHTKAAEKPRVRLGDFSHSPGWVVSGVCVNFFGKNLSQEKKANDSDEVWETAKPTDHMCNRTFTVVARSCLVKMECRTILTA